METTTKAFDIHLIMVGVAAYLQHLQTAKSPYPIPDISQWAFNRVHARQALAGEQPTLTASETLAYLTQPVGDLFSEGELPPDLTVHSLVNESLHADGRFDLDPYVTEYLDEHNLNRVHDVRKLVDELDNAPMKSLKHTLHRMYDQEGISAEERLGYEETYRKIRAFLSAPQNAITNQIDLMMTFSDDWERVQQDYLRPCAEVHHRLVDIVDGEEAYRICDRCGPLYHNTSGTLEPIYTCPPDCPGVERARAVDADPLSFIIRYAHQKRVLIPGVPEIRLYDELMQRPYVDQEALRLFPGIDRYDIRVVFRDGTTHALDIKDHVLPYSLARNIKRKPHPEVKSYEEDWLAYDEMFYLVPLNRVQDMKAEADYMKPLEDAVQGVSKVQVMPIERYLEWLDNVY
jgi:hypothetical protein